MKIIDNRAIYPMIDKEVARFDGKLRIKLWTRVRVKGIDGVYRFVIVMHRLDDIITMPGVEKDEDEAIVDFVNRFHHECYNVLNMYQMTGEEQVDPNQEPEQIRLKKLMGLL